MIKDIHNMVHIFDHVKTVYSLFYFKSQLRRIIQYLFKNINHVEPLSFLLERRFGKRVIQKINRRKVAVTLQRKGKICQY